MVPSEGFESEPFLRESMWNHFDDGATTSTDIFLMAEGQGIAVCNFDLLVRDEWITRRIA
jgi:hypothetical protein